MVDHRCAVVLSTNKCYFAPNRVPHCSALPLYTALLNVLLTGAQCAGGATAGTAARAQSAPAMRGSSPWRRVGNIYVDIYKYLHLYNLGQCIDVSVPGAIPNWFGAPAVKLGGY